MADLNIHHVKNIEIEYREVTSPIPTKGYFIVTRIYITEETGIEHTVVLYSNNKTPIKLNY